MKRRLSTILSALSLLLCVAVCVLWVRSYRHFDGVAWAASGGRAWQASSRGGRLTVMTYTPAPHDMSRQWWSTRPDDAAAELARVRASFSGKAAWQARRDDVRRYGFVIDPGIVIRREYGGLSWSRGQVGLWPLDPDERQERRKSPHQYQQQVHQFRTTVPYWVMACVLGLPLVLMLLPRAFRWHQSRRRRCRVGLCPSCGYDLRATLERCPECGATAAQTSAISLASSFG